MRRTAHVWQQHKCSLIEMTSSFVISMAANIINPALPRGSASSSVQSHRGSACHRWSTQAVKDKCIAASVFTTTITQCSIPTHVSNMCGCVPIDLHVSGLNFWLWLWAENFFSALLWKLHCELQHAVCQQSRRLALDRHLHILLKQPHWEKRAWGREIECHCFLSSLLNLVENHLYGFMVTFRHNLVHINNAGSIKGVVSNVSIVPMKKQTHTSWIAWEWVNFSFMGELFL